jgi:hypothetical protein
LHPTIPAKAAPTTSQPHFRLMQSRSSSVAD